MTATAARWDLLLGDEREKLDVYVDHLIDDPPYGARTHAGFNAGSFSAINGLPNQLKYECWTPDDVHEYVDRWSPRTLGWMICMTSHDLIPAWERAFKRNGRYDISPVPVWPPFPARRRPRLGRPIGRRGSILLYQREPYFLPKPFIDFGKCPRITGDGAASWTCYVMTARPRSRAWLKDWQARRRALKMSTSLQGAYKRAEGDVTWSGPTGKRIGGKPLGLMREIVLDYTFAGQTIAEPHAGHATGMRACIELGRHAIGCEIQREVWLEALERLRRPVALDLFAQVQASAEQREMFAG